MHRRNWYRACFAVIAVGAISAPVMASACCPSGGNGSDVTATSGLGESQPLALDLARDPAWAVYRFARDGVEYTQINDTNGIVRAAVGNIDGTAWVLPVGVDADRVLLAGDALPAGRRRALIKSSAVEVDLIETAEGLYWLILPVAAGR